MIADSVPWRNELEQTARRLRRRVQQQRWTERTFYLLERDLIVGFYAVRRLMESDKTSSRLGSRRVGVRVYSLTGREPSTLDRWSPWEYYDVEHGVKGEIDLRSLSHEFIHSFVLTPAFDEQLNLSEVWVGSDRTKRRQIYGLDLSVVADLFEYVAEEEVVKGILTKTGPSVRVSQHDLVDAGLAEYTDALGGEIREVAPFDVERLIALPGFDSRARQLLALITR